MNGLLAGVGGLGADGLGCVVNGLDIAGGAGLYTGALGGRGVGVDTGVTLWHESGRVVSLQLDGPRSHVDEGKKSKSRSALARGNDVYDVLVLSVSELDVAVDATSFTLVLNRLVGTPLRAPFITLVIRGPPTLPPSRSIVAASCSLHNTQTHAHVHINTSKGYSTDLHIQ